MPEKEIIQFKNKGRKQTFDVSPTVIKFFSGNKKHCSSIYNVLPEMNVYDHKEIQEFPRAIDDLFYLCKFRNFPNQPLPGWTGFNTLLSNTTSATMKTNINYFPVLDCNPTEMSTINILLEQSVEIANHLKIDSIVIVMD